MIFKPILAAKVMRGDKVETRRPAAYKPQRDRKRRELVPSLYKPGHHYAVQPGRGQLAIGRVMVTAVDLVRVGDLDEAGAHAEGFESVAAFVAYWRALYAGHYDEDVQVWRIRFHLYVPEPAQQAALV